MHAVASLHASAAALCFGGADKSRVVSKHQSVHTAGAMIISENGKEKDRLLEEIGGGWWACDEMHRAAHSQVCEC